MVLLVIDEAQNLSLAALEELRMLSNLETEKSKLLQIVLVGQPNLRDKLSAPELEQLRQRITVSYHLQPLDADETANYINHRLRRAATGTPMEFPREVTDVIHARSRGVPRVVNVICDAALVFGYAEERLQVDLPLMQDVLVELEATGVLPAHAPAARVAPEPVRPAPLEPEPVAVGAERRAVAVERPQYAEAGVAVRRPSEDLLRRPSDDAVRRASQEEETRIVRAEAAARAAVEARLAQREAALQQRERELAEQRRILAEEYRLLRSQRAAASTTVPSAVTAGSGAIRVHVPVAVGDGARAGADPARFGSERPEGVWAWIKRHVFGMSHRALEGN
jgi:hypothetical protein